MKIKRRKFLKLSAIAAGAVGTGGIIFYAKYRDKDPLDTFYESTQKVLSAHFGQDRAKTLIKDIRQEYQILAPGVPYIGGKENIFTEWLTYGAYFLAVYHVLKPLPQSVDQVGRIIYETYEMMADYPEWLLHLIGSFKYSDRYVGQLKEAAAQSQKRKYPGDWVCSFVEGNGKGFDYGLDIKECGIHKFYRSHGAEALTPYLCLSDYVVSKAFGRGLVRYQTLAEGTQVCDFRYKKGRETFVYPLRHGWPPQFRHE